MIQSESDPEKRLLLAAVYHVDDAIGQVVQALDEKGLREKTLILFSSDNGPQGSWGGHAYPDDLKLTKFNQPLPMSGKKLDVYEGGIHVPGLANWPGRIQPKTVTDQLHIIDWFPTLGKLTGSNLPDNLDGTDLAPVLFANDSLEKRDLYWIWNPAINRWALRYGDWKVVNYGKEEPAVPSDWQLFNLKADPREKNDMADQHPEELGELHRLFLKQRAKDLK